VQGKGGTFEQFLNPYFVNDLQEKDEKNNK